MSNLLPTRTVPIDSITVGARIRQDLGDLGDLIESMRVDGLMAPVVVDVDGRLIAGARRLEAAKQLGWETITISTATGAADVAALLRMERDENTCRKDFTPSELGRAVQALTEIVRKEAAASHSGSRQRSGQIGQAKRRGEEVDAQWAPTSVKTDQVVADALGVGKNTVQRVRDVMDLADSAPEEFGDLPDLMDSTSVFNAHEQARARVHASDDGADLGEKKLGEDVMTRLTRATRKHPPKPQRNPMLKGTHRPDTNKIITNIVDGLNGLVSALELTDPDEVDHSRSAEWAASFSKSMEALRRRMNRLLKEQTL